MKSKPSVTYFAWGGGATKFGPDTRHNSARILRGARRDMHSRIDRLGANYYRIVRDDVTALIRTR